jgi:RNA polymerase sigma-70 factor (ECF subfamily)
MNLVWMIPELKARGIRPACSRRFQRLQAAMRKTRRPADRPPPVAAKPPTFSDAEICRALRAGEPWAAEATYDRVKDVVDAVVFRLLGPGDVERDDIGQQAIERVISTIISGRFSQECSLRSWATLITQHLAIDAMRLRARERKLFDRTVGAQAIELIAEDSRTPDRALEASRRVERLVGALSKIKRARAEAVVLHDIFGYSLAEIAELTGDSVAAIQSRLVRGRGEVLRLIAKEKQAP